MHWALPKPMRKKQPPAASGASCSMKDTIYSMQPTLLSPAISLHLKLRNFAAGCADRKQSAAGAVACWTALAILSQIPMRPKLLCRKFCRPPMRCRGLVGRGACRPEHLKALPNISLPSYVSRFWRVPTRMVAMRWKLTARRLLMDWRRQQRIWRARYMI